MGVKAKAGVFTSYERALTGPEMTETQWDREVIPQTAKKMKEKYNLKFDKKQIIPADGDLLERLYQAGLDMLSTCGTFCTGLDRVIKYTKDEILAAVAGAPDRLVIGEGRDAAIMAPRYGNDPRPPLCQGGPTGAPVSEDIFVQTHEAFAREPLVDCVVDGVLDTIYGHPLVSDTPWDIAAAKVEAMSLRDAVKRAGRPGMGF